MLAARLDRCLFPRKPLSLSLSGAAVGRRRRWTCGELEVGGGAGGLFTPRVGIPRGGDKGDGGSFSPAGRLAGASAETRRSPLARPLIVLESETPRVPTPPPRASCSEMAFGVSLLLLTSPPPPPLLISWVSLLFHAPSACLIPRMERKEKDEREERKKEREGMRERAIRSFSTLWPAWEEGIETPPPPFPLDLPSSSPKFFFLLFSHSFSFSHSLSSAPPSTS